MNNHAAHGDVTIKHHSTSSLVEITVKVKEEVEWGKFEDAEEVLWLDYGEFEDLKKAINKIDKINLASTDN